MSFYRIYGRVLRLLGPERGAIAWLGVGIAALVVAQFAEPVIFGKLIDRLTRSGSAGAGQTMEALLPMVAAWIGFALATIVAAVFVSLLSDRLAHRRRLAVMALLFDHLLDLPMTFHAATHSGRTLKIMIESANGMFAVYLSLFRENAAALLSLVVILPLSLWLNWRLGLLLAALVGLFGCISIWVRRRTERLQNAVERHNSRLAERASDVLGNIPVIQSFTRTAHESGAMRDLTQTLLAAQMPVLSWWTVAVVCGRTASTITLLLIFVSGTALYLHGIGTIGGIVMFMNFANMLIGRLEQLVNFFNALFLQAPKLGEYFAVLDTVPHVADRPHARDPGRLTGQVGFHDVGFAYPGTGGGRRAVAGLTFVAQPGQTIALVGATGSGKSTTLGLLYRTFDPLEGAITIDGRDIRDLPLEALRRNIGVVFQEPMLFARSIEDNLRIGKPGATAAELKRALERAQAAEFVAHQPDGLATIVGERGRTLSGGERQRLAIARALLKDPPIMIFDEATAALDAATEQKLQRALISATEGRTTFIIAHRLATIRHASTILVLEGGTIVEAGTFDELVGRKGPFASLARAQFMAGAAA